MRFRNLVVSMLVCLTTGYLTELGRAAPQTTEEHADEEQGHPETGPHGGHLVELGDEEYHAEIIHDEDSGQITIHLLDGSATKLVAIPSPHIVVNLALEGKAKQFKFLASPIPEDAKGNSSRFVLKDEELATGLDHEDCKAVLVVTIGGKQFRGEVEHEHE